MGDVSSRKPKAEKLYRLAIESHDNSESAVKDLASLLQRQNRAKEAIELLVNYLPKAKEPINTVLDIGCLTYSGSHLTRVYCKAKQNLAPKFANCGMMAVYKPMRYLKYLDVIVLYF